MSEPLEWEFEVALATIKRLEAQLAERDATFAAFITALESSGLSVYQMPDGDWAYAVLGTISDGNGSAYGAIWRGVRYAIEQARKSDDE